MGEDMLKFLFLMLSLGVTAGVTYTLIALGHALAQRAGLREGKPGDAAARLIELDDLQARMGEVEERLDFAERQLAQRPPAAQLPAER